jgi:hypothetical protein
MGDMIDRICTNRWTYLTFGVIDFMLGVWAWKEQAWEFFALNVVCVFTCVVFFFLVGKTVPK